MGREDRRGGLRPAGLAHAMLQECSQGTGGPAQGLDHGMKSSPAPAFLALSLSPLLEPLFFCPVGSQWGLPSPLTRRPCAAHLPRGP